ncbi:MAG: hypothetical protein FJ100_05465 [Deltaproteobacteria bacterium]|nr:hypothetical protein [Deltaproteobacteria bacterium]
MISIIDLAVLSAGFFLQTRYALTELNRDGEPIDLQNLALPVELLPEGLDKSDLFWPAIHGKWPMFSESCNEDAAWTAPYRPRRLALWWYLKWPWQCELLHWLTTCKADVCEGIRFAGEREDPPFHVHAPRYGLAVRCDETLDHSGPRFSMGFACEFDRPGWYRCRGGADEEFSESDTCPFWRPNCFPCATPADLRARRDWIRTQEFRPNGSLIRRPP